MGDTLQNSLHAALPHSRAVLTAVIVAHVSVAWALMRAMDSRYEDAPPPLVVQLLEDHPAARTPVTSQPPVQQEAKMRRPRQTAQPPPAPLAQPPEPPPLPTPIPKAEPPPVAPQIAAPVQPEPKIDPPAPAATQPEPAPVPVVPPANLQARVDPAPVPPARPAEVTAVSPPEFGAAYLNNPTPTYPALSRRFGEQGTVLLRVYVTVAGDVEQIELKSSCGFARLDEAARRAVAHWKFVPAKSGSEPVNAWVIVPIRFSLRG